MASHDRYPDLLDEPRDPELARVVSRLDAIGRRFTETPMPAARSAWIASALRERALAKREPRLRLRAWRSRGAWPARRVAMASAAALTTIAVLTGATVALGIPVFPWNFAVLQQTGQFPQIQAVNIASSAHGYTLRLSQVYADANVFIAGYSATAPGGSTIEVGFQSPVVTDAGGVTLPESDYGGVANLGGTLGTLQYQAFDTGGISGRPGALALHMVVPSLALPRATPGQPATSSGDVTAVPGPFVFDITVAYHGGRELRPHLTVTQSGRAVTLERIVSTPLETRFYVSGSAMNAYPTLTIGGHTLNAGSWGPDGDLMVYRFQGSPPYQDHGAWTFAIHERGAIDGLPGEHPLPPGVWTFTVTLP